jgi:hypothetical protein
MNTPKFTAEASLYKVSRRYRTGRHVLYLPARLNSPIHPAMEKIEVHGCAPGSYLVEYDDGTWDCWSNPDPWWGGGGGSGTPGMPSGGGTSGKPGGGKPGTWDRPTPGQAYAERVRRLGNLWYDACGKWPDQKECCNKKQAKCIEDSFHPAVDMLCRDAGQWCRDLRTA